MMGRFTRAVAALLAVSTAALGVPVLLVSLVGNPYPDGGLTEVELVSDSTVLGLLAVLGWLLWAQLMLSILWEIPAARRRAPSTPNPLAGRTQQRWARVLVNAVLLVGTTSGLGVGAAPHAAFVADAHAEGPLTGASPTAAGHGEAGPGPRPATSREDPAPAGPTASSARSATPPTVRVAVGDSLWDLAERHLGSGERWREIADLNRGRAFDGVVFTGGGDPIRPGWVLRLPADATRSAATADGLATPAAVEVQPGDTLWEIADARYGEATRWPRIYASNRRVIGDDPDLIRPGQVLRLPDVGEVDGATRLDAHPDDTGTVTQPAMEPPSSSTPTGPPSTATEPGAHLPAEPGRVRPGNRAANPDPVRDRGGHPSGDRRAVPGERADRPDAPAGSSGDAPDVSALRAVLAAAGFLASGALTVLLAHQRRQFRRRSSGRTIGSTPQHLVATKRALIETGSSTLPSLEFVDLALRHLAAGLRTSGGRLPPVGAARLDRDGLRLLLDAPTAGPTPAGWTASDDARAWSLARTVSFGSDDEIARLRDQPSPYPTLVSVGIDAIPGEDQATWLIDLESAGVVPIAGDPAPVSDLIRFLVAELAVNPWAEGVEVLLAEDIDPAMVDLNPRRLRRMRLPDAMAYAARLSDRDNARSAILTRDLPDARLHGGDGVQPVVIVTSRVSPPGSREDRRATHAGNAGSRVAVLHPAGDDRESASLVLPGDGTAVLPGWGATVRLHQLPLAVARNMAALVAAAATRGDEPMPGSDAPGLPQLTDRAGALRPEHTVPRTAPDPAAAATPEESSLLPQPDEVYLEAAATTAEDLAALAPRVPPAVRDRVQALDGDLDADLAAWRDSRSRRPRVRLLGPVTVEAWGPRRGEVGNRLAAVTEVVAYLACQDHGATPEQLAEALGVKTKSAQNRTAEARKLLGDAPDGAPWLPEAGLGPTGRTRRVAVYELAEGVLVDADLFRRLRARGQARGREGIEDLAAALALVTGRPFDQLRPGGYGWLAELPVHQFLTAAVVDVAHVVSTGALAGADLQLARWASEVAIRAAPYEDKPRLDLAAVESAEGRTRTPGRPRGTVPDALEEVCNGTGDDVPEDLTERSSEILRHRGWLAS